MAPAIRAPLSALYQTGDTTSAFDTQGSARGDIAAARR
jgi:hypothetical protein